MVSEILYEVAAKRMLELEKNRSIKLSSIYMKEFCKEMGSLISKDAMITDIKFTIFGEDWNIINRAYKDETNDEDVEEEIFKILSKHFEENENKNQENSSSSYYPPV